MGPALAGGATGRQGKGGKRREEPGLAGMCSRQLPGQGHGELGSGLSSGEQVWLQPASVFRNVAWLPSGGRGRWRNLRQGESGLCDRPWWGLELQGGAGMKGCHVSTRTTGQPQARAIWSWHSGGCCRTPGHTSIWEGMGSWIKARTSPLGDVSCHL